MLQQRIHKRWLQWQHWKRPSFVWQSSHFNVDPIRLSDVEASWLLEIEWTFDEDVDCSSSCSDDGIAVTDDVGREGGEGDGEGETEKGLCEKIFVSFEWCCR